MTHYYWSRIEREELNPAASRQVIHSERMTVARLSLKKGAVVPSHHHENEQLTMLESGRLLFQMGGDEITVEAGEVLQIPPNVPHGVVALEDSLAVDLFSPPREDWKRGDDAYLRQR
jgi:quercetin dioxygenase-like cupin family protein